MKGLGTRPKNTADMKKQIIIIHGGDAFNTYEEYLAFLKKYELNFEKIKTKGWKDTLGEKLGKDFEVILPKMPNSMNARYKEWKIMFNKFLPFFKNNLVLVGHSLGGIFLAKYLSENKLPKKILATFLVAAPYRDKDSKDSLGDFILPKNLEKFQEQGGRVFICHSQDDPCISFADLEKYQHALPQAKTMMFKNRKHFNQAEFPELVSNIKKLYS